jgi:hypothetical protein
VTARLSLAKMSGMSKGRCLIRRRVSRMKSEAARAAPGPPSDPGQRTNVVEELLCDAAVLLLAHIVFIRSSPRTHYFLE